MNAYASLQDIAKKKVIKAKSSPCSLRLKVISYSTETETTLEAYCICAKLVIEKKGRPSAHICHRKIFLYKQINSNQIKFILT